MTYSLRHMAFDDKICQQNQLEIFEKIYPRQSVFDVLTDLQAWEDRERRLNMAQVISLMIAGGLWPRVSYASCLRRLVQPLQVAGLDVHGKVAKSSAIAQRRQTLGKEPLKALFQRHCRPMTSTKTRGAFRFGRRIMAIDGTVQDVPDTPANRAFFGRSRNQKGFGPFPQVRGVSLAECGSHAIVDVEISGLSQGERTSSYALLRSVTPEMFVLNDSGFSGALWWQGVREKGAHGMGPLPVHHLPIYCRELSDGSYLAAYVPDKGDEHGLKAPVLIRVMEYRITDERLGEPDRVYRLGTTWLNPRTAPAEALIELYHERWEIESMYDEIKTHLSLQKAVMRSRTPEGVQQELYAILLAHYAIRFLMHESAREADLDPDRLSFTQAVTIVEDSVSNFTLFDDRVQTERLWEDLLWRLREILVPERRLRANPRVLKKLYRKFKQKKRGAPPPEEFEDGAKFLDYVTLLI